MAGASRTRDFFENGSSGQFEWILSHYDEALRLKAESKSSKPENVIKLDKWYQTELPKKIKSRGKEAHLIHDELVQTIKWKVARGKFQANMVNLIQMNTPRVVMVETKKAFRKLSKTGDIQASAQALCNLKGVGPTMASAVLAAGAPHLAPFMADECLLAMPDGESLDYTMKEYMRFVEFVQKCVDRLKAQGGDWDPHKVELAVWTHSVLNEYKAELILDMPSRNASHAATTTTTTISDDNAESNGTDQDTNGSASASDEERGGDISSVANGEDSALSPPPSAMADFENTNSMESEVTTNNGDHSEADNEDSNMGNNGTSDSNHSVQNEHLHHEIAEASNVGAGVITNEAAEVSVSIRGKDLNTDEAMPNRTSEIINEKMPEIMSKETTEFNTKELTKASSSETVAETVAEAVAETVAEAVAETVAEAAAETVAEAVAETVAEAVAETVAEAAAETVAEAAAETVAEAVSETVAEAAAEGVAETVAEAVTDEPSAENPIDQIQPEIAPSENGSTKNGVIENGSLENGAVQNGSVENGSVENGLTENGLTENGTASSDEAMEVENGAAEKEAKQENGAKEVLPAKVPEVCLPSKSHPDEVGDDLPVAKRTAEDDLEETPPVKKLKPENTEPASATV